MDKYIDADDLMRRMYNRAFETDGDTMWQSGCWVRYRAIEAVVKETPAVDIPRWIPVKIRPMDSEEREYWEEHTGFTLTDDMAQTFDCPMPDDGQRIWVQTKNGFVFDDVCDSDCDGIGLEGNGDWDDIIAWMPMNVPEPWKGEENG